MNLKFLITLILVILLSFLFSYIVNSAFAQEKVLESLEKSIAVLVESTKPSLVTIEGEIQTVPDNLLSYYAKGKKPSSYSMLSFVGSGVIYTSEGYILTTTSVVQGMDQLIVLLPDGKRSIAKLVGTDNQSNIAVLKVDAGGLKPAKLGDSDKVKSGSWVTVVGNSYGLPTAVSFGLVNGIREDGYIQMSVSVSPGNSGGPVLSTDGSVVGLVSARMAEPSYIEAIRLFNEASKERSVFVIPPREIELPTSGVSLAIPINKVKATASDIIKYGTIERGYLGVYPEDAENGALIVEVVDDSPADKAGLKSGDIIIEFKGEKVKNEAQLRNLIASTRPDEKVKIIVFRDDQRKVLEAVIGKSKPVFGQLTEKLLNLPPAVPEVELPIPEVPDVELYYEAEKYREAQEIYQEEIRKLKEEMKKISKEMERSRELKKAKEEQKEVKEGGKI
jgi:serine protease Do